MLKAVAGKNIFRRNNLFSEVNFVEDFKGENTKGVALVKMESGEKVYQPKIAYLRMKKAGRKVELIAEAPTREELDEKLRR